jgi:hypothetical protein
MTEKELCLSLMKAETEDEIINILSKEGYWNESTCWRLYGDNPSNYSSAGNQADIATSALVEKITNSRDAILMNQCFINGIKPKSDEAPKNITDAVAMFFDKETKGKLAGQIKEWTNTKRREVAQNLAVYLTGNTPTEGYPCVNIADLGEGQTPEKLPKTILSLGKKNKKEIPFVHGKWNMGGTAALLYCGEKNLQLVVSRRNSKIFEIDPKENDNDDQWSFTIVRREDPVGINDTSVYKYLAPINTINNPNKGDIISFQSETMPLFPDMDEPYSKEVSYGTLIKLYEFQVKQKQMIGGKGDTLLRPLDLLAIDLGFPFRLHECRYRSGKAGQRVHQVNGLITRLFKNDVVEKGFPTYHNAEIQREDTIEKINFIVYALKRDKAAATYRDSSKGVIFALNGQSQGWLNDYFFARKKVGLGFLKKSLIVVVNCNELTDRGQEKLFVNDRVHIRQEGPFWEAIENELVEYLRTHQGLSELQEERQRKLAENKLDDSKPLETVLSTVFKHSTALSKIFLNGERLSNAFKAKKVKSNKKKFIGKKYPTYFKHKKLEYGKELNKTCPINTKPRMFFETDALNNYFNRKTNRGEWNLFIKNNDEWFEASDYGFKKSINLLNGIATLNLEFPNSTQINDKYQFLLKVTDNSRLEEINPPFENAFCITVGKEQIKSPNKNKRKRIKPPSNEEGTDREKSSGVKFPKIYQVYESDYDKHEMNKYSGMQVVKKANLKDEVEFIFFVNMDNIYLKHEIKDNPKQEKSIKGQFEYGMALLGISMIYDDDQNKDEETKFEGIENKIFEFSRAMTPIIIPMIREFGQLDLKSDLIDQLTE